MRARLVVFPIKGRHWCFSRSIDHTLYESGSSYTPSSLKDLWKTISSSNEKPIAANAELLVDFISNKMNRAWINLEKAPEGTFKSKIHGLGLRLLAGVKPSEIFLKSITKEVSNVEVTYPPSLNARLVRQRLRHIAIRGAIFHKRYFYGSASLLPLTTAFTILPLPNVPFFWVLYRTYSHWQALKGSEKLLQLISDGSLAKNSSLSGDMKKIEICYNNLPWVLQPSAELEKLLQHRDANDVICRRAILDVCKAFNLNTNDVLKYRKEA